MNIRPVKFDDLTTDEVAEWAAIQRAEPLLASPFFRPEFTQAVSEIKENVEVAVLEEEGQPVGFFPYERGRWNHGVPVGTRLSDYQGVIVRQNVAYDPVEIVRACGLSSWRFDHLLRAQSPFADFVLRYCDSPCADLSQGFEIYESTLAKRFRSQLRRRLTRLEHEVGPVRVEIDVQDRTVISKLMDWKISQYERTRGFNVLGIDWVRALLERILEFRGSDFSATLAALYAGDKLIAAKYALRSGSVLHSWFSAYDRDMATYAPGSQLAIQVSQAARSIGITSIDFGKGKEEYKRLLQTGATPLIEGAVDLRLLRASVRSAWWAARGRIASSPLRSTMLFPLRTFEHFQEWLGF